MQTEIIYGFGFEVTDVEEAALIDFIKNHKTAALKNKLLLPNDDETVYPETRCKVTETEGCNASIENIMQTETGVDFEFRIEQETQREFIILRECMPWMYNTAEMNLTEESLTQICKKYMSELDINENPTNIRLEYFE